MASTNVGSIHYDLDLQTDKFDSAISGMSGRLQSIGQKMTSIGKTMTIGLTLPILAGFGYSIKQASDFQETLNKVSVAFKDQAGVVRAWGETTLKSIGLARGTALDMAALFGDMATSMGLSTDQSAKMSMSLVNLAGDLASFKNINISEAQTALAGIFTGETESLKRLGVIMTDTNVKAYALANGFKGNWEELQQAEKVTWRYKYVLDQTKNSQGDFANTFGSTANQIRFTQERVKQLSQEFGEKLLPVTGRILEILNRLLDKFASLTPKQQDMIIKIMAITAVVGPLLVVIGSLISSIGALLPVIASPVFWIVVGVLSLIAGAVYFLYQKWEQLKPTLQTIKDFFMGAIYPALSVIVQIIKDQLLGVLSSLRDNWNTVYEATKPYHEQLKIIAQVIGFVLVGAIVVVVGAILGLIIVVAKVIEFVAQLITWIITAGVWIDQWGYKIRSSLISAFHAVIGVIGSFIGAVASIPGRVVSAIGNLGGLLWNAGSSLITGLWEGMKAGWEKVKGWLSGLAGKIKDLKGPLPKDKIMLVQEGNAIMQGLDTGIKQGYLSVAKTLKSINSDISGLQFSGSDQSSTTIYGNVNIGQNDMSSDALAMSNRNQTLLAMGLAPGGGL